MCLIQYLEHPFFRNYNLLLTPWINFSHLFIDLTHTHLHYIFLKAFRHKDLTIISFKSRTQQGDSLGGMLFTLAHFCALHHTTATHLTCVFPLLANDMHIVGPTLNVLHVFLQL
jgi:hypothetical protein